jgi:hypothetical protein
MISKKPKREHSPPADGKRRYVAPQLIKYGPIARLTGASLNKSENLPDGATNSTFRKKPS